jgi:hypothetical protein
MKGYLSYRGKICVSLGFNYLYSYFININMSFVFEVQDSVTFYGPS